MASCPPRGRTRALTSTTPRSVSRPGLPSLKITSLIPRPPLLAGGAAAVGVPAVSEPVGGAGEPQPIRATVASDRIAKETVNDLLLDVIATLLLLSDDRTDEDPLAGYHHVRSQPPGRPAPSTARMNPLSAAILTSVADDCKRHGTRAGSAARRTDTSPRATSRSSESGVEFGDVLRLIFDRITSGLLGAGRTLCRRLGTRTPLRTLCQALTH